MVNRGTLINAKRNSSALSQTWSSSMTCSSCAFRSICTSSCCGAFRRRSSTCSEFNLLASRCSTASMVSSMPPGRRAIITQSCRRRCSGRTLILWTLGCGFGSSSSAGGRHFTGWPSAKSCSSRSVSISAPSLSMASQTVFWELSRRKEFQNSFFTCTPGLTSGLRGSTGGGSASAFAGIAGALPLPAALAPGGGGFGAPFFGGGGAPFPGGGGPAAFFGTAPLPFAGGHACVWTLDLLFPSTGAWQTPRLSPSEASGWPHDRIPKRGRPSQVVCLRAMVPAFAGKSEKSLCKRVSLPGKPPAQPPAEPLAPPMPPPVAPPPVPPTPPVHPPSPVPPHPPSPPHPALPAPSPPPMPPPFPHPMPSPSPPPVPPGAPSPSPSPPALALTMLPRWLPPGLPIWPARHAARPLLNIATRLPRLPTLALGKLKRPVGKPLRKGAGPVPVGLRERGPRRWPLAEEWRLAQLEAR
mmetsp:Transcript_123069/g.359296  ORF Transcript_123069/g.359296 Transcript_123069/m.359296 type:complete len:469 (-) Transcript_123069:216-1622(-)